MTPGMRQDPNVAVRFLEPELPPLTEVAAYYRMAEEAGWYSNDGPCAQLLSQRLSERLGGPEVIPVANCTLGLIVALRAACGEPTGTRSKILLPSFTFTATAASAVWAGFEPVFVDVLPESWQLDPVALATALAEHDGAVAGVLATSTFGTAPPTRVREGWRELTEMAGVPLLVDAAAGYGSVDGDGRPVGGLGETEIFSFHATKPFAVGEGGAIVTPDRDLAERMRRLINFGMEPGRVASQEVGVNAKCSELHAATALAMLDRYDDALARRRASVERAQAAIGSSALRWQAGSEGSTWQVLQALAPSAEARDAILAAAREAGVQARSYFDPPLHRQPAYARWAPQHALPVTDDLASRAVSLPMANDLGDDAAARIGGAVRAGLASAVAFAA